MSHEDWHARDYASLSHCGGTVGLSVGLSVSVRLSVLRASARASRCVCAYCVCFGKALNYFDSLG